MNEINTQVKDSGDATCFLLCAFGCLADGSVPMLDFVSVITGTGV